MPSPVAQNPDMNKIFGMLLQRIFGGPVFRGNAAEQANPFQVEAVADNEIQIPQNVPVAQEANAQQAAACADCQIAHAL